MIRILHCVSKMNLGGIETLLMNLYRSIDREKVQFDFLTDQNSEGFYDEEIKQLGGVVYYSTPRRQNIMNYKKNISKILNENSYSIIHVHVSSMSNIDLLKVAKKLNISNRIIHCHNTQGSKSIAHKISHFINRLQINSYATHKFACSKEAGIWGFKKIEDVKIFRNAIDIRKYEYSNEKRLSIRKELAIENDELLIGHVGRFVPQKNHKKIIEIFNDFQKKYSNCKLLLIGEGKLKEDIIELTKKNNLKNKVIFISPKKNVNDYYQAMDVFLFPSLFEGLGMVTVEAQISNLPIITSTEVPLEAKIADEFYAISLRDQNAIWSKNILNGVKENVRKNNFEQAITAGYDISKNAEWIEKFYKSLDN